MSNSLDKLVCPKCKQALVSQTDSLFCDFCNKQYPVVENIPLMMDVGENAVLKESLMKYYSAEAKDYNVTHGSSLYGTEYNLKNHYLKVFRQFLGDAGVTLEFGSGTGRFAEVLREFTDTLYLSDISLEMLLQNNKTPFARICTDTESLPFPDAFFDTCVGVTTFAYLPDKKAGIRELRRVLKPGGRLFILDMNRSSIVFKLTALYYLRHRKSNRPRHINESNLVFLRKLFADNRFTIDGTGVFSWIPHAVPKPVVSLLMPGDKIFSLLPIIRNHAMRLYITGRKGQ